MISEDEFWDVWGVITAPDADFLNLNVVQRFPRNHVWTVVESGDWGNSNWYAMPGIYFVNRLGYVITCKPWEDPTLDAMYCFDRIQQAENVQLSSGTSQ